MNSPDVEGLITKTSPRSLGGTVGRLLELVRTRGMTLVAVVDHSGEAARVGLELRDTKLVIFGSPQAGRPVMQARPLAAIDLPLRVLVWSDGDEVRVTYPSPSYLAARHHLDGDLAARLAGIDALTDALVAAT